MRTTKRVMINVATRWLATLVQGGLGLFVVRFLLGELGQEGYGLTALMGVVVSFAAVADLGLGGALSRHLAAQLATGDQDRFNELASTAFTFYLAVGSALAVACGVFAPSIAAALNVPASLTDAAVFLLRWYAAPAVLLSLVSPAYWGVIASANRFDIGNWIAIGTSILRAILLLTVLRASRSGLYGWAGVALLAQVVALGAFIGAAYRVKTGLRISPMKARWDALTELVATGSYLFLIQLTLLLGVKADPLILTTFLGPAAVALYASAATLVSTVRPLVTTLADQLHPLATVYHEFGDRQRLQEVLVRGTRYTLLLGVGACVALCAFAQPFAQIWLGSTLGVGAEVVAQALMLLAAIELFSFAGGSQWAVLLGAGRLRFQTWTFASTAIVNVGASAALVRFTNLGVLGVLIPTLVLNAVRRPVMVVHTARVVGLPVGIYLRQAYLGPAALLVSLAGSAITLRLLVNPTSLGGLAVSGCALGVLFLVLCWLVGLNPEDKAMLRSLLSRPR